MSDSARARANAEQRRAADPTASAFVAASAGCGKTKLLTDCLLRLMLADPPVPPQRIQCHTFTKAATVESAVRLQNTLDKRITLHDAALNAHLANLAIPPSDALRRKARAPFAEVLDPPVPLASSPARFRRRAGLFLQIAPKGRSFRHADRAQTPPSDRASTRACAARSAARVALP